MQIGMKIGHDENVIKEMRETVMQIIGAPVGDNVKVVAMKTLVKTLAISGMSVSDCHIQGDTTHTHHHYPEPEQSDYEDEDDDCDPA